MAFSTQRATSDGTLSLLDISIEYFDRSEIAVLYDGVLQTSGWSWIGTTDKKVSFSPPVPNGVEVMLVRTTDLESVRHVFTLGAAFTTQSLDEDLKQILHIAQEAKENATIEEVFHNLNMHGYRLVNVGPGIADTDGANMLQMNAAVDIAQAAAAEAANSAATINVASLLSKAANLSDVANPSTARSNLGAQSTLISGTNIKTVNGASILGSGDIAMSIPDGDKGDIIVSSAGTVWAIDNGSVTPEKMSQPLTLGTVQATTSGTARDFTGIPSWVKRITLMFSGVRSAGVALLQVQIGTVGGLETTGYTGGCGYASTMLSSLTSFPCCAYKDSATEAYSGSVVLTLADPITNTWTVSGNVTTPAPRVHTVVGRKALSGTLSRLRVTNSNGTDLFDAGSINILYE